MPSMNAGSAEVAALRGLLARSGGRAGWRDLERVADSAEFRSFLDSRHPSLGAVPRQSRAASDLAAHGGIVCLRWPEQGGAGAKQRLQRDRALCAPAHRAHPHGPAILRLRHAAGRHCQRRAGDDDRWPPDQDRRQSRSSLEQGRDRYLFGRLRCWDCTIPTARRRCSISAASATGTSFQTFALGRFAALQATHGHGLHLLTGPISSPTLIAQIQRMQAAMPEMHWHVHAPAGRDEIYSGAQQAFGKPLETRWNFDKAELIVSLDGDFLDAGPHQAGASRAWIEARRDATKAGNAPDARGRAGTDAHLGQSRLPCSRGATRPAAAGAIAAGRPVRR